MSIENTPPQEIVGNDISTLDIYRCYRQSKYFSMKHSTYFPVYEEILGKYRGKEIVFVEIGILNGGSLFMWQNYLGEKAKIIGIDFNPDAKKWEKDGFEIHIGNQSDPAFWNQFFSDIGKVDVILDDGGHTNPQQVITTQLCVPHINDGGVLIVEDVHASYLREFGNPSKYSFINYAKNLVDANNSRFPGLTVSKNSLRQLIYSICFYESIVCFHIDRKRCVVGFPTSNEGISFQAADYRHEDLKAQIVNSSDFIGRILLAMKKNQLVRSLLRRVFAKVIWLSSKFESFKLRKYFR